MGVVGNKITNELRSGLDRLGLISDDSLFFVKDKNNNESIPEIWFHLEKAEIFNADAVFFKKGLSGNYIPQIYVYDYTSSWVDENLLTQIHKNIWTGGEVPIVCVFTKTDIKILDTTSPIVEKEDEAYSPKYLIESLKLISKVDKIYNTTFAQRIKAGTYWDNAQVSFNKSSYKKLTELLRKVIEQFTDKSGLEDRKDIVQKLIIQCILVKYLEERKDNQDNTVFPSDFFKKYGQVSQFSDILKNKQLFDFFSDLNKEEHFNGGIFSWSDNDRKVLSAVNDEAFGYLANVLEGYTDKTGQGIIQFEDNFSRLYSFNYIPVELISRLYEEFIIKESKERKKNKTKSAKNDGVAYTPSHLVKLLVNEVMPLNAPPDKIEELKILDPACGSAIFLVVAFKRLVQWWRQKNKYKKPDLATLKRLLSSLYGVDTDKKAIQISVFSLCIALCDELSPKQIWNELRFDHLEGSTIFNKDFFKWEKKIDKDLKFDVIIGNPPFERGALDKDLRKWEGKDFSIEIPQGQIALKFLADSLNLLSENGRCCLVVKAMQLLYSNSNYSKEYLNVLANKYQLNQIFDFTPLARNGSLWDGADVEAAAVFVTNQKLDKDKNVLHAVFRRTRSNVERIYFEIDHYDLNWILREEIARPYLFKINLLGNGRIKNLVSRIELLNSAETVEDFLSKNQCNANEGFIIGTNGNKSDDFIYEYDYLPTEAFKEDGIDFSQLKKIGKSTKFVSIKKRSTYEFPNLLIKENIGKERIPVYFNRDRNFMFKDKVIGIYSLKKDKKPLQKLYDSFKLNNDLYRLLIFVGSSQLLINKNTAILKEDIDRLPIFAEPFIASDIDKNVINNMLNITQYFIRNPEKSEAIKPIKDFKNTISFYGNEFSKVLNDLYADKDNEFRLTDIIKFGDENLIGSLFSYDNKAKGTPTLRTENEISDIEGLINFNINENLTATRIIKYYTPNRVLLVKPNQKRFWTASIAYRDADEVFADILNTQ